MKKKPIINKARSRTFGIVINPKIVNQDIDWKSLTMDEISKKIKESSLLNKFDLIEFENVKNDMIGIEDFEGQFKLVDNTRIYRIPHYQIALGRSLFALKNPY
jgi:hypothetical protein